MMPPFEEALQRLLDNYAGVVGAEELISALGLALAAAKEQHGVD